MSLWLRLQTMNDALRWRHDVPSRGLTSLTGTRRHKHQVWARLPFLISLPSFIPRDSPALQMQCGFLLLSAGLDLTPITQLRPPLQDDLTRGLLDWCDDRMQGCLDLFEKAEMAARVSQELRRTGKCWARTRMASTRQQLSIRLLGSGEAS
jgi:hypothetical protein